MCKWPLQNMLTQCVFCFCNLDERHYNSDICVHCLHEPLLSGAIENVPRFKQCTQCDQIICPFHSLPYNLDADICVVCDRNFAYTPYNSNNINDDTLMDSESEASSDQFQDSEEESDAVDSQNSFLDDNQHMMDSEDDAPIIPEQSRAVGVTRDQRNIDGEPAVIVPVESHIILAEHTCCICLDSFDVCKQVVSLKCHSTHIFHFDCISTWFSTTPLCPFGCNKQIQKT